jgi:hypothetical protein
VTRACTWEGCQEQATEKQLDKSGSEWADLCRTHHDELETAITTDFKAMMRCWVKAKGGAKKAAERMTRK